MAKSNPSRLTALDTTVSTALENVFQICLSVLPLGWPLRRVCARIAVCDACHSPLHMILKDLPIFLKECFIYCAI